MAKNKLSTIPIIGIPWGEGGSLCSSHQCSCCTKGMPEENRVPTWALGNLLQVSEKHFHVCLSFTNENFISGNVGA
jgi:hypothetical protein